MTDLFIVDFRDRYLLNIFNQIIKIKQLTVKYRQLEEPQCFDLIMSAVLPFPFKFKFKTTTNLNKII